MIPARSQGVRRWRRHPARVTPAGRAAWLFVALAGCGAEGETAGTVARSPKGDWIDDCRAGIPGQCDAYLSFRLMSTASPASYGEYAGAIIRVGQVDRDEWTTTRAEVIDVSHARGVAAGHKLFVLEHRYPIGPFSLAALEDGQVHVGIGDAFGSNPYRYRCSPPHVRPGYLFRPRNAPDKLQALHGTTLRSLSCSLPSGETVALDYELLGPPEVKDTVPFEEDSPTRPAQLVGSVTIGRVTLPTYRKVHSDGRAACAPESDLSCHWDPNAAGWDTNADIAVVSRTAEGNALEFCPPEAEETSSETRTPRPGHPVPPDCRKEPRWVGPQEATSGWWDDSVSSVDFHGARLLVDLEGTLDFYDVDHVKIFHDTGNGTGYIDEENAGRAIPLARCRVADLIEGRPCPLLTPREFDRVWQRNIDDGLLSPRDGENRIPHYVPSYHFLAAEVVDQQKRRAFR